MKRTVLAGVLCMSAASVSAQTGAPIKIAGSFDMSGPLAQLGKDALLGVQYAVEILNNRDGVLGRKVELEYQDNGTNPGRAIDQTTALVRGGAVMLVAPQSSTTTLAVTKSVSAKLKVPMCVASAGADEITIKEFQPYMFSVTPNVYLETRAKAARLAKLPYKRYALLIPDYAGGRSTVARFKAFLKALNPQVEFVVEDYPKLGAVDYTASINKILAAKPDYVYSGLSGNDLITFSKQATAIGFFKRINSNFNAMYDETALKALGESAAVGSEGSQRAPAAYLAKASPQSSEYIGKFKARYGMLPSDYTTLAYDCVMVWAQAATIAKTTDADPIIQAIETNEFSSTRGPLHFAKYDHQADGPIFVGRIEYSNELQQPVLAVTEPIPGRTVRPSEAEVLKLRQAE